MTVQSSCPEKNDFKEIIKLPKISMAFMPMMSVCKLLNTAVHICSCGFPNVLTHMCVYV